MTAVTPLMEAYDRGDLSSVEQLVVARLCEHPEEIIREPRFPEPGSLVPALRLPVMSGVASGLGSDSVSIPDPEGRYVLLDFWATWCGPCVAKYPEMLELANDLPEDRFTIVGVLRQDSPERAVGWLESNGGIQYRWANDRYASAAKAYGVKGIPHMFLIDPQGRLVGACLGCQSGSMSPDGIRKMLSERF